MRDSDVLAMRYLGRALPSPRRLSRGDPLAAPNLELLEGTCAASSSARHAAAVAVPYLAGLVSCRGR